MELNYWEILSKMALDAIYKIQEHFSMKLQLKTLLKLILKTGNYIFAETITYFVDPDPPPFI